MPFLATDDGVRIYYEDHGQGQPVVLMHGWSGSRLHYAFTKPALQNSFRVITYDHRGHGASDRPAHGLTLKRLAKDLAQLMEELNLEDVTLVGWSMGAHVLFETIRQYGTHRLKKAVIVDMAPKLINDSNWTLGIYHGRYDHEDNLEDLSRMCDDWETFAEMFIKRVVPGMRETDFRIAMKEARTNSAHVMTALWIAMSRADYREILSEMKLPTLVVFGGRSTLYSLETADYMRKHLPDAQLEIFDTSTHMLVLEEPKRFHELVASFVAK